MALRALVKSEAIRLAADRTSVSQLYRSMIKELPRVLTIYDIDIPMKEAKASIAHHFRKHSHLKDGRVVGILLAKGYMELEETLMQWKQKSHLMRIFETGNPKPKEVLSPRDQISRGLRDFKNDEDW